jgi:heat shock protein HslJ
MFRKYQLDFTIIFYIPRFKSWAIFISIHSSFSIFTPHIFSAPKPLNMKSKIVLNTSLLVLLSIFAQAQTIKTFLVAEYKDSVLNIRGERCLLVKEKKKDAWRSLCEPIDSFSYEEGYKYEIQVAVSEKVIISSMPKVTTYKLVKVLKTKKTKYKVKDKFADKKWTPYSLFDGKRPISLSDTAVFMLLNLKKKQVNGRGTCNDFSGKLKLDAATISITELTSTKMMCDAMDFETAYFSLLPQMTTYKLGIKTLTLTSSDGVKTIMFRLVE